jgi:6,7-dimethyl-8-ribityllumazine synthase
MPKLLQGELSAKGLKFAILASRFNNFVVDKLIDGAVDALVRHGADDGDITLVRVPGSFEIPVAAARLLESHAGAFDAVICLGAVIRGQTPHFDYIAAEVTKGIAQVSLQHRVPIAYGVLTTDTLEQAIERAGTKAGNKGVDAAVSAMEMANLFKQI